MRNWRAILVAVLMPFTAKAVAAQRSATPNRVEQDVSDRVRAYFAAMSSGKASVVAASLADDYLVIGGDGKLETRAQRLTWLAANARNLSTLTLRELRVRSYDRTAVATGLVVSPPDATTPVIEERFTQVWVARAGVWRMVSGQITIVRP